jgi:hypothetical protein
LPKTIILFVLAIIFLTNTHAQKLVSGVVFDSSRITYVPNVKVTNKCGDYVLTDSLGRYKIHVYENDSLSFSYNNKNTLKYAVKNIINTQDFNLSLHINYKGKYKVLKEVVVFTKDRVQDSIENRRIYANAFGFVKNKVGTSINPSSGAVGMDLGDIVNLFRFKRNKQLQKFKLRLEKEEQEKFINYRFSKTFVKRITGIAGHNLNIFMARYRPTYEFASTADVIEFNQYVLNCSYAFKASLM